MADVKVRVISEADNKGIDSSKTALKEFKTGAGQLSQELFGVNIATLGVGAAVGAAGKFIIDATRYTIDYASSVKDLSRNLRISAEEASTLIQIGDDFKVNQGEITAALQMAVKNGFVPTIENLSALSDEYNKHTDPVERAAAMTKIFGRNWTTLTPILEAGRDAIKASAKEAADMGLVLSEKDVKAAHALEISMDGLNDSLNATKLIIGQALIPGLTNAANAMNVLLAANSKIGSAYADHKISMLATAKSYEEYVIEMRRAQLVGAGIPNDIALRIAKLAVEKFGAEQTAKSFDIYSRALYDNAAALKNDITWGDAWASSTAGQVPPLQDTEDATKKLDKAVIDYAADLADALQTVKDDTTYTLDLAAAEKQLADDTAAGWWETSQKIKDDKKTINDLKDAHHTAMLQMQVDLLQYGLTLDGTFDASDQQRILDYELKLGLLTQAGYDEATATLKRKDALDKLPTDWSATYKTYWMTYYITNGEAPGSAGGFDYNELNKQPTPPSTPRLPGQNGWAEGTNGWVGVPDGYPNDGYNMGRASSGEEFAVRPKGSSSSEGGVTVENYGTIIIQGHEDVKESILGQLR